jgi:hypothetical protein
MVTGSPNVDLPVREEPDKEGEHSGDSQDELLIFTEIHGFLATVE